MAWDQTIPVKIVLATLKASTGYGATSVDAKYPTQQVQDVVNSAILELLGLIASRSDHPDLATLGKDSAALDSGTVLNEATLPKVGAILGCRVSFANDPPPANSYWPAEPVPLDEVRRFLADEALLGLTLPWYVYTVHAGRLFHPGTKAILRYVDDDFTTLPDLFGKYTNAVAALALAHLLPFQGDTSTAAGHFYQIAERSKAMVLEAQPAPPIEPYRG